MGPTTKASPSIAFSGAGFLTSYHLGVVDCLRRHGIVGKDDSSGSGDETRHPKPSVTTSLKGQQQRRPMILSGVSGGALAATSIVLDIRSDDAMSITLKIAQCARKEGGILDLLHPR
jgi:predicted acylesterase/phospholipase RssA